MSEMMNIPTNSLTVKSVEHETRTVRMKAFYKGIIVLTGFAVMQFIEGAAIHVENTRNMFSRDAKLLINMTRIAVLQSCQQPMELEVSRTDLETLRTWLFISRINQNYIRWKKYLKFSALLPD